MPSSERVTERSARRSRRRGLGLVETLLCVMISSMLVAGVAMAFRSSVKNFQDLRQRGQILRAARGGLHQIIADIRAADSAAPYDPVAAVAAMENSQLDEQVVPGNPTPGLPSAGGTGVRGIRLVKTHADVRDPGASSANPVIITYWLDAPSRTLYMTRQTAMATPAPFPVCRFAQSMQIYMQPMYMPPNPPKTAAGVVARRVVVTIGVTNHDADGEGRTFRFSDSAIPRTTMPGV